MDEAEHAPSRPLVAEARLLSNVYSASGAGTVLWEADDGHAMAQTAHVSPLFTKYYFEFMEVMRLNTLALVDGFTRNGLRDPSTAATLYDHTYTKFRDNIIKTIGDANNCYIDGVTKWMTEHSDAPERLADYPAIFNTIRAPVDDNAAVVFMKQRDGVGYRHTISNGQLKSMDYSPTTYALFGMSPFMDDTLHNVELSDAIERIETGATNLFKMGSVIEHQYTNVSQLHAEQQVVEATYARVNGLMSRYVLQLYYTGVSGAVDRTRRPYRPISRFIDGREWEGVNADILNDISTNESSRPNWDYAINNFLYYTNPPDTSNKQGGDIYTIGFGGISNKTSGSDIKVRGAYVVSDYLIRRDAYPRKVLVGKPVADQTGAGDSERSHRRDLDNVKKLFPRTHASTPVDNMTTILTSADMESLTASETNIDNYIDLELLEKVQRGEIAQELGHQLFDHTSMTIAASSASSDMKHLALTDVDLWTVDTLATSANMALSLWVATEVTYDYYSFLGHGRSKCKVREQNGYSTSIVSDISLPLYDTWLRDIYVYTYYHVPKSVFTTPILHAVNQLTTRKRTSENNSAVKWVIMATMVTPDGRKFYRISTPVQDPSDASALIIRNDLCANVTSVAISAANLKNGASGGVKSHDEIITNPPTKLAKYDSDNVDEHKSMVVSDMQMLVETPDRQVINYTMYSGTAYRFSFQSSILARYVAGQAAVQDNASPRVIIQTTPSGPMLAIKRANTAAMRVAKLDPASKTSASSKLPPRPTTMKAASAKWSAKGAGALYAAALSTLEAAEASVRRELLVHNNTDETISQYLVNKRTVAATESRRSSLVTPAGLKKLSRQKPTTVTK